MSDTTYTEILARLEAVRTVSDLQSYAEWLYDSDALDESEQTRTIGSQGPLAPWSTPDSAEIVDDNGEDVTVRLESGECARWSNSDRAWSEVECPELDDAEMEWGDDLTDETRDILAELEVDYTGVTTDGFVRIGDEQGGRYDDPTPTREQVERAASAVADAADYRDAAHRFEAFHDAMAASEEPDLPTTIDPGTRRSRGVTIGHGPGAPGHGPLTVTVDAAYAYLMRLRDLGRDRQSGEGRVVLDIHPTAELSAEVSIVLSETELRGLADLIQNHVDQTERRTDGLRPTSVR